MSALYYCQTRVPETDGSEEQYARAVAVAKEYAIREVKFLVKQAGEDFDWGHVRVTGSMDSNLEVETVIAEWWVA